jgi:hypothetical protein
MSTTLRSVETVASEAGPAPARESSGADRNLRDMETGSRCAHGGGRRATEATVDVLKDALSY